MRLSNGASTVMLADIFLEPPHFLSTRIAMPKKKSPIRKLSPIFALVVGGVCWLVYQHVERTPSLQATTLPAVAVHFSPNGGCTASIVREINAAQNTILVQAYWFTSSPIAKALIRAHQRGVRICVILDKSQKTAKYSVADLLHNMGIPVWIDAQHSIAHNKVMILDGSVVITGSFNFTKAAEQYNAENLLILRDKDLSEAYTANWLGHRQHSEPYGGKR